MELTGDTNGHVTEEYGERHGAPKKITCRYLTITSKYGTLSLEVTEVASYDPRPTLREYNEFTEDGELISSTLTRRPKKVKGRWYFVNSNKFNAYMLKQKSLVAVKVLLYLASKMTFTSPLVKTTKTFLATQVGCTPKQIWQAVQQLKKDALLVETSVDGQAAYLLNPNYFTIGGNVRSEQVKLWEQLTKPAEEKPKKYIDKETGEVIYYDSESENL